MSDMTKVSFEKADSGLLNRAIRSAETLVANLAFDLRRFSTQELVTWLETTRERKFLFFSGPMPPGMYGVWFSDRDYPCEYVFFDRTLSPLHQRHVKLHEIAHFLFGHPTQKVGKRDLEALCRTIGIPSTTSFQTARMRSLQQDKTEVEAEVLATLLQLTAIKQSNSWPQQAVEKFTILSYLLVVQKRIQRFCPPSFAPTLCWHANLDFMLHRTIINILDGRSILGNALQGHGFEIEPGKRSAAESLCQTLSTLQDVSNYHHLFNTCRNLVQQKDPDPY